MITRHLASSLREMIAKFPVLAVLGPRQSGKTTLVRSVFPDRQYVSLENPDIHRFASDDPRAFLANLPDGGILDEVQRVPGLFSYLQTRVDETGAVGQFILSGSNNFLLNEKITQSLAGRVSLQTLLPFSRSELAGGGVFFRNWEEAIFKGFYPALHDRNIQPGDYYPDYIQTYLERDVRQLRNIGDLDTFQHFLKLCAGRIGQLINLSSLGNDLGVSYMTVKAWISILKASYIIFELPPYYRNLGKRLIKSSKLYFVDPGLACALLEIRSAAELTNHYLRGRLFENLVIIELIKEAWHRRQRPGFHFFRDRRGQEIDLLIGELPNQTAIEIKSGRTVHPEFFQGLDVYGELATIPAERRILFTGGDEVQTRSRGRVLPWQNAGDLIREITL